MARDPSTGEAGLLGARASSADTLVLGFLNSAVRMLEDRYASREDIDAAVRLGCGHPTGPLALLDQIGLDRAHDALQALHARSGARRHVPAPLLAQHVSAGLLGCRTGRGFYTYAAPGSSQVVADESSTRPSSATPREVRRIGVVGTGTMASGIVEVCARAGYDVVVRARSEDGVVAVLARVAASLDRALRRGLDPRDRDAALARVCGTTALDDLGECDLVVEAVVEELAVKQALFAALDEVVRPGAVLATTTSSLPVVACAQATGRPRDVVGMHWFNPPALMRLVEVVPTAATGDDVVATVVEVCRRTGKHPVVCGDRAGFIVNALLFPYLDDAAQLLDTSDATVDELDAAVMQGYGHPLGPFALMDVVGLDVTLAILRALPDAEPGAAPAPVLERLVRAGCLGRKTGRGFRDHAR